LIAGRIPDDPDYCVVGCYRAFPEEVTASDLLKISIHDIESVTPAIDVVAAAVPLFQSLFRARSDWPKICRLIETVMTRPAVKPIHDAHFGPGMGC
jgi:hypothetical protein